MMPTMANAPTRPLAGTFLAILLALGVLSHLAVGVHALPIRRHPVPAAENRETAGAGLGTKPNSPPPAPQTHAVPPSAHWAPLRARAFNPSKAVSKALSQAGNKGKSGTRCIGGGGSGGSASSSASASHTSSTSHSSSVHSGSHVATACPAWATGGFHGPKGSSTFVPASCYSASSTSTSSAHKSKSHSASASKSRSTSASKSWSSTSSRSATSASHSGKGPKTCHRKTSSTSKPTSTVSATSTRTNSASSSSAPSSSASSGHKGTAWPHDGYTKKELRADLKKIMKWAYDMEQLKGDLFDETVEAIWSATARYWNEMPARPAARIILADMRAESDFNASMIDGSAWGLLQVTPGEDSNELALFKKHATVKHHKVSWETGAITSGHGSGPLTDYKSNDPLDVSKLTNHDLLRPWINIHVASWIQTNLARTGSNDPYDWQEISTLSHTVNSASGGSRTTAQKKLDKYFTAAGLPYTFETALGSWLAGPATDGSGSYHQKDDHSSADYLNSVMSGVNELFGKNSLKTKFLSHWKVHSGLVDYNTA